MKSLFAGVTLLTSLLLSTSVQAQASTRPLPMAPPLPTEIPAARDEAYAGTIDLAIDASDITRGVYRVTQTIPVAAGTRDLVLLQPGWLPGNHSETGPYALLADIRFYANGKEIPGCATPSRSTPSASCCRRGPRRSPRASSTPRRCSRARAASR
ncbi:hypothetical protein ACFSHP_02565 [Novosphingobium panipatense]